MHPCLNVDEILRRFARELVLSEAKASVVSLACCCKDFEDPVLGALWKSQNQLFPLLEAFPPDVWKVEAGHFVSLLREFIVFLSDWVKSFERIPTKAEWSRLRKYAREMRELRVDTSQDPPITSDVLFMLQLRATNEPLLPNLKIFRCCANEVFIPFIPLFPSCETTSINIKFPEGSPALIVASVITRLSTLCIGLGYITLKLPEDPLIIEALSEMLLACNRDALQCFYVDSPLTKEARNVLFQLPKVSGLWAVFRGYTQLPPVVLPNLSLIDVEFDSHLGWLQGFRGGTLDKLETVCLRPRSEEISDILGEFKSVALTTSIPTTLLKFSLITSRSWDPNYRSLLPFTQLRDLVILFSCEGHCSSRLDDDIIMDLARAMPKLKILRLGGAPCRIGGGVTVKGLIALGRGCRLLSELRIHFETASFVEVATGVMVPTPSNGETIALQQSCALTNLDVGRIPIPTSDGTVLKVTMILLRIFPRLLNVKYVEMKWKEVVKIINLSRQIGDFVQRTGKTYFHIFSSPW